MRNNDIYMINLIDRALQVLQEMIKIVENRDYEKFLTYISS